MWQKAGKTSQYVTQSREESILEILRGWRFLFPFEFSPEPLRSRRLRRPVCALIRVQHLSDLSPWVRRKEAPLTHVPMNSRGPQSKGCGQAGDSQGKKILSDREQKFLWGSQTHFCLTTLGSPPVEGLPLPVEILTGSSELFKGSYFFSLEPLLPSLPLSRVSIGFSEPVVLIYTQSVIHISISVLQRNRNHRIHPYTHMQFLYYKALAHGDGGDWLIWNLAGQTGRLETQAGADGPVLSPKFVGQAGRPKSQAFYAAHLRQKFFCKKSQFLLLISSTD